MLIGCCWIWENQSTIPYVVEINGSRTAISGIDNAWKMFSFSPFIAFKAYFCLGVCVSIRYLAVASTCTDNICYLHAKIRAKMKHHAPNMITKVQMRVIKLYLLPFLRWVCLGSAVVIVFLSSSSSFCFLFFSSETKYSLLRLFSSIFTSNENSIFTQKCLGLWPVSL